MKHQKVHDQAKKSFPVIVRGVDEGYKYTKRFNPEWAEHVRDFMFAILKPLMALRALLYRKLLWPITNIERSRLPVFRLCVIVVGFYIILNKNVNVNFSINHPFASTQETNEGFEEEAEDAEPQVKKVKSDYAPVSSGELTEKMAQDYIDKYADLAKAEMKKYGIPASITLAQALVESRAGTSRLARENSNHFGIKCFSKSCKKGHCTNHFDDHHKDFFRKYDSVWKSYRDHSIFLKRKRYAHLTDYGKDYKKWAKGLREAGYATDRRYHKKLIGIINKYDLSKYDK